MRPVKLVLLGVIFAIGVYYFRIYMKGSTCHLTNRIDGKDVLITGANSGIGFETAVELASRGGVIHMACRDDKRCEIARQTVLERSKADNKRVITYNLDLASIKSILKFTTVFKATVKKLDILINNAGIMMCPYQETEDGFEKQFGVNHLGHFLLTNELLGLVKAASGSRIIIISSLGHEFGNVDVEDLNLRGLNYGPMYAYALSKLANVLHAKELAKRLRGSGIAVVSVHPGSVATELQREWPQWMQTIYQWFQFLLVKTPMEGAQTQICCALNPNLMHYTGAYFSDVQPASSMNRQVYNDTLARNLWLKSEMLIDEAISKL